MIATINIYTSGVLVRVRVAFTDRPLTPYESGVFTSSGVLPADIGVDPPSVACTAKKPDGTETTPPVTKDAVGVYHADIDTTGQNGEWYVRMASPAGLVAQGAGETRFITHAHT